MYIIHLGEGSLCKKTSRDSTLRLRPVLVGLAASASILCRAAHLFLITQVERSLSNLHPWQYLDWSPPIMLP